MQKERRLFVRFLMSGVVVLQLDPQNPSTIDCELIDLSYDGVGLYSPERLAVNSKVKFIVINRQLNVNIGGIGRAVYCNPAKYSGKDYFRVGLEFLEADRQQVRDILIRVREISEPRKSWKL